MPEKTAVNSTIRQPFHRVHRTFFVGLFILVPAVLVPVLLVYSLGKHEVFQKWRELHTIYESSYGLSRGDIVTISDIRVGHVTRVELTEDGRALVTFRILERHAHLLNRSSRAVLRQKNILFGDWVIALTTDSLRERSSFALDTLRDHDTLIGVPPLRLDRVIAQLTSMVSAFEEILREVSTGEGLLGTLVGSDSLVNAVYGVIADFRDFARIAKSTAGRLDRVGERVGRLGDRGVLMVDSLEPLVDSLAPAIEEARRLLASLTGASEQLSPVLHQAQTSLREIEVLVRGLQHHWLLRRAVARGRSAAAHKDSAGVGP